jgi:hypothetical protein
VSWTVAASSLASRFLQRGPRSYEHKSFEEFTQVEMGSLKHCHKTLILAITDLCFQVGSPSVLRLSLTCRSTGASTLQQCLDKGRPNSTGLMCSESVTDCFKFPSCPEKDYAVLGIPSHSLAGHARKCATNGTALKRGGSTRNRLI